MENVENSYILINKKFMEWEKIQALDCEDLCFYVELLLQASLEDTSEVIDCMSWRTEDIKKGQTVVDTKSNYNTKNYNIKKILKRLKALELIKIVKKLDGFYRDFVIVEILENDYIKFDF